MPEVNNNTFKILLTRFDDISKYYNNAMEYIDLDPDVPDFGIDDRVVLDGFASNHDDLVPSIDSLLYDINLIFNSISIKDKSRQKYKEMVSQLDEYKSTLNHVYSSLEHHINAPY
ncbi:hypothetical protein [Paenibacillus sp. FSL L8-0333]|uniref:hypothetical protein n=1 Tax=Paenibacillus sp. FSL L8-0333 TaxID=2975331 RepID=UPI0030CAA907